MTSDLMFPLARSAKMLKEGPEEAREAFRQVAKANAEPCPSCGKVIVHRKGLGWCQDNEMSEATLQKRVMGRAKTRGWRVEHVGKGIATFDSKGDPIWVTSGMKDWPDLFFLNPRARGHKVFVAELKRQSEEPTPGQAAMLALFNACGIPGVVLRPNDLRKGHVNAILEGR